MIVNGYTAINGVRVPIEIEMEPPVPAVERWEIEDANRKIRNLNALVENQGGMRVALSGIADLIRAVQQGKKILAIKALRSATPGLGLKEAKDVLDGAWDNFRGNAAEKYEPPF